ncbi:MAG TPA: transglycosylase SLT domain-containing protein [Polyangia bacterium]|nr:transglycosylase SLT domain-containing protein [Polyangia bacterium]
MSFSGRGVSAAAALVAAALSSALAGAATPAGGANSPGGKEPSRAAAAKRDKGGATLSTGEESPSERRAVRGVALDAATGESPELKELRRFEEQTFPRAGQVPAPAGEPYPVRGDSGGPGGAELGQLRGHWAGTGDLPAELRTPDPAPRFAPPAGDPDSDWLRTLKLPELPVRWDPQVLRYLDYFRADPKGRAVMASWLKRAGRFRGLFEKTLDRYGLPRDLFYVAMIESGFEPAARSRAGAGGIWQFMPSAARTYGLEISYWVDSRRDPERSADAAARYLKDLYVRFGSWPLVFAAYNAGYGAVLTSITRYNTNDFWELCRHESGLPWESSIYVPKIMAAAIVGHNLEAFGFADLTPDPPFAFDRVEAAAGTTFAAIARAAGTRPEVVAALNSHLIRERTPPDRGVAVVRVPPGSAAQFAETFEKARAAADRVDTVVLRFGETIDEVARARGLAPRELRRLNGVKESAELRAGVTIVVPRRAPALARNDEAADKDRDKGDRDGDADSDDDQTIVAVPDRVFTYEGRERVFYRTRDGDSLDEIAETFAVLPDDIVEWNNLDPSAKLQPRLILQVFVRKDFDPTGVLLIDPARVRVVTLGSEEFLELTTAQRGKRRVFYTCKSGDNLAKVGRRYGLTAGDLARINRFSYNSELHEGQKIVVYSPTGDAPREVTMGLTPDSKRPAGAPPRSKGASPSLVARSGSGHGSSPGAAARGARGPAPATKSAGKKK